MYRKNTCGELNLSNCGQNIKLAGWIQSIRNFGKFTFIDLRDRYGITQLVINPDSNINVDNLAREYVVVIEGKVSERENKNLNISTGSIEIVVAKLDIINTSELPPFTIINDTDGSEELRLRYRYLDIRRPIVKDVLLFRAKLFRVIREYLDKLEFVEIETPTLMKSTPEGARDFLVPSRLHQGSFYALPQSPQILKQLLMVSGMDRYYQIVKCYRDEDFRGDRQPEFTQLDCEMSFVSQEDVIETFSGLVKHVYSKMMNINNIDIQKLTFEEAMQNYGSDKPDLRFDCKIINITEKVSNTEFPLFNNTLNSNGTISGIVAKNCSQYSRKQIDEIVSFVKEPQRGLEGIVWIKKESDSIKSSIDKFITSIQLNEIANFMNMKDGDCAFIGAGKKSKVLKSLGDLRLKLANDNSWIDKNKWSILWILDFPLFEEDEDTGETHFVHHPFCMPNIDDLQYLENEPLKVRGQLYDLVINGNEILSGSIRIHDANLQNKIFDILGLKEEEKNQKFGFLLEAFKYGAPPHGGCAFGIDRWIMLMTQGKTIRDTIAFPKSSNGKDLMMDAPAIVEVSQLKELGITLL